MAIKPLPLSARPMDVLYFVFFALHAPITVFLDVPSLFPKAILPQFVLDLNEWALVMTNDPLVQGAQTAWGEQWTWLQCFFVLEGAFQLPTFLIGLWGLYTGSKAIYPLLIAYGSSTATTVVPCLATLLITPRVSNSFRGSGALTQAEFVLLLTSYVPFLLLPLWMAIDMSMRTVHLIQGAEMLHVVKVKTNKTKQN